MISMDRAEAFRDLESVYAELEADIAALSPRCELSGRCCRFKEYKHQLWTTRLELEYLLEKEGPPPAQAGPDGVCPWLREGRCSVRDHRMLGCRIFFCDESYQSSMGPLYEKHHARIRDLHRRHGIAYDYFEFLDGLTRLQAEGSGV